MLDIKRTRLLNVVHICWLIWMRLRKDLKSFNRWNQQTETLISFLRFTQNIDIEEIQANPKANSIWGLPMATTGRIRGNPLGTTKGQVVRRANATRLNGFVARYGAVPRGIHELAVFVDKKTRWAFFSVFVG